MKSFRTISAVGTTLALLFWGASPAFAENDEATSFEQLAATSAPEILTQTEDTLAPSISTEGDSLTVTPDIDSIEIPDEGELIAPPKFTIDFASSMEGTSPDGVVELSTGNEDSSAFLQPIGEGFRVLTSTENLNGPSTFSYTLDVPADSRLVEIEEVLFVMSGEDAYGILGKAWAKDANGNDVPTWYTLENGVLTQHLDLIGVSAFPVLADPAWSYAVAYPTNKSTYAVTNLIGTCFNCYFPVPGAPRRFPVVGQLLPLRIGSLNFEVTMATVSANPSYTWFQYSFYATANHFDGAGSAVSFTFQNQKLYVYGWVVNDYGLLVNGHNLLFATNMWSVFASNLRRA